MIAERSIGGYHTFIGEGQMAPDEVRTRQARHLKFLRRKILEDLKAAEKIWVWKEAVPSNLDRILTLLETLQRFGPNKLLWVTMGDETHPPGTVEQLGPSLIRAYVKPRPEEGSSEPFPSKPWFEACEEFSIAFGIQMRLNLTLPKWNPNQRFVCPPWTSSGKARLKRPRLENLDVQHQSPAGSPKSGRGFSHELRCQTKKLSARACSRHDRLVPLDVA